MLCKLTPQHSTVDHNGECHLCADAEIERLRAALKDVLRQIEKSDHWWMVCPDKGGFDVKAIEAALGSNEQNAK